jgi:hypothetical protein
VGGMEEPLNIPDRRTQAITALRDLAELLERDEYVEADIILTFRRLEAHGSLSATTRVDLSAPRPGVDPAGEA